MRLVLCIKEITESCLMLRYTTLKRGTLHDKSLWMAYASFGHCRPVRVKVYDNYYVLEGVNTF